MAAAIEMKLEGAGALRELLKQLPPAVGKKHMRRAIRQGIALVRNDIKATAPIRTKVKQSGRKGGSRPKPGRLRRLVRIKARRGKRGYLKVSLLYPTEGDANNPKNAFYWFFVEEGTRFMQGAHYIQRAVDNNFQSILRKVISETTAGVREEINKSRGTK